MTINNKYIITEIDANTVEVANTYGNWKGVFTTKGEYTAFSQAWAFVTQRLIEQSKQRAVAYE